MKRRQEECLVKMLTWWVSFFMLFSLSLLWYPGMVYLADIVWDSEVDSCPLGSNYSWEALLWQLTFPIFFHRKFNWSCQIHIPFHELPSVILFINISATQKINIRTNAQLLQYIHWHIQPNELVLSLTKILGCWRCYQSKHSASWVLQRDNKRN